MRVKRHREHLPSDFMLPLNEEKFANLRLQIATSRLNTAAGVDAEEFDLDENEGHGFMSRR